MRQRSVLPHIVVHPCLCLFALCPMKSQYSDRLYAATSCAARGPHAWRRRLTRKSSCVMLAHVSCPGQQIGACDGGGSCNPLETASELAGEHVGMLHATRPPKGRMARDCKKALAFLFCFWRRAGHELGERPRRFGGGRGVGECDAAATGGQWTMRVRTKARDA